MKTSATSQHPNYITRLHEAEEDLGGKASGLQFLKKQGLHVPASYLCKSDAFKRHLQGDLTVIAEIRRELESKVDLDVSYAVRSSADIEDHEHHSFAGQFTTVLDVKGADEVCDAIQDVWDSVDTQIVQEYTDRLGLEEAVKMSLIVQEMVEPEASGVVFTCNPLNGREEVIVEAVAGRCSRMLQGGETPLRWVYKRGKIVEAPDEYPMDEPLVREVIETSIRLESAYGAPLDLEWVVSDGKVWWIQLREITALGDLSFYSNEISREQLPGLITPLIWSINTPLVCGSWINLLNEMLGDTGLHPHELAKQFYCRAYYNMGAMGSVFERIGIPPDTLEQLMGHGGSEKPSIRPNPSIRLYPRLVRFAAGKLFYEGRLQRFLDDAEDTYRLYSGRETHGPAEAMKAVKELFNYNQKASYYVIVSQLLHTVFNNILRGRLRKAGVDPDEVQVELDVPETNPNHSLSRLKQLYDELTPEEKSAVESYPQGETQLHEPLRMFLDKFGHLSDSGNDFSTPTWAETPEKVVDLVKHYHVFKGEPAPRLDLRHERWWLTRKVRRLHSLKERVSFSYTRSYGLFRDSFLRIADAFTGEGYIEEPSDIFYLTMDEVEQMINSNTRLPEAHAIIKQRRNEMKQHMEIEPPSRIYGEDPPPPLIGGENLTQVKGLAASNGYYKGRLRHVKSISDFTHVEPGDVVVVPFSDISWSPLFVKSGAIISESGGVLSHAAVIAREFRIPAVLSVEGAFRLPDGQMVVVDGFTGTITVV